MKPIRATCTEGCICDICNQDVPAVVRVHDAAIPVDAEREALLTVDICHSCLIKAKKLIKPSPWNRLLSLFLEGRTI